MTHNDIRHKLSEYIDGSVAPDERTAIDDHLATCAECSDALRELRKTIEAVKQIEEVDAPAWMTSKIMANVRDEQEAKKDIWHRVVAFFTMKYPIQALTVLFLAVTAYYIYGTINPAQKYAGEPVGVLAKKEAPAAGRMQEEDKSGREAAPEQKLAPQTPGYKSLDMKYSYEKPAAPVPAEAPAASAPAQAKREVFTSAQDDTYREKQAAPMRAQDKAAPEVKAAAPAPTKQEAPALAQTEADLNKRPPAPRAMAPFMMSERSAPAAGASAEREADAQLAVTEQFAKNDLPGHMKIKGLSFSVRKYQPDQTDLQWLPKTAAYRSQPCSDRYIVDVDLSGKLSKYLYCYDGSKALLIGVFELRDEVWSEHK
jgi:hypothetical protein